MDDDDVEPRLGRMRTTPIRHGRSYMSQVLRATNALELGRWWHIMT